MGVQVAPPFVEYDHSTSTPKPDPAALNEAVLPDATVSLVGCVVIAGPAVPF
jgi:hypothetical protein